METTNRENRSGLKFKFALFYLLSVGIIVYLLSLFLPGNTSSGMLSTARPMAADAVSSDFVPSLEAVNTSYKNLKELDQEYAQQTTAGAGSTNEIVAAAESRVNKSLDSLAVTARSLTDRKLSLQLQNFVDAYRFALNDRSAMRVYKIAALTSGKSTGNSNSSGQEALTQMQNEVAARDKRIAELQNQNYALEQRIKTAVGTAGATTASQQNIAALQATISDQEKKIANLTTVNSALEKQNSAYSKDAGATKPAADNGAAAALKSQNALLEKQVASLTAEVRLAQVDCSLTRADATQIISNSKQRKVLLSDALVTLNGLSATSDAAIRKKVTDKMVKLNQVASNVRD